MREFVTLPPSLDLFEMGAKVVSKGLGLLLIVRDNSLDAHILPGALGLGLAVRDVSTLGCRIIPFADIESFCGADRAVQALDTAGLLLGRG